MNPRMKHLGAMLRMTRLRQGFSLAMAAQAVGLLDVAVLREIEAGERDPDLELALNLASFYGVTLGYLTGETRSSSTVETTAPRVEHADHAQWATIMVKMPHDMQESLQQYADRHRESIGELLRQAITWRLRLTAAQASQYFPHTQDAE